MIFSSSGSRTWGTHSFRTAVHRWPGSFDLYLHELWGLSEVTTNQTNPRCFGADWHLCSKPRSPSVSGHLPPEQPCLHRVMNDFKMANICSQPSTCWQLREDIIFRQQNFIMQDSHKSIIGITKWRLFCLWNEKGFRGLRGRPLTNDTTTHFQSNPSFKQHPLLETNWSPTFPNLNLIIRLLPLFLPVARQELLHWPWALTGVLEVNSITINRYTVFTYGHKQTEGQLHRPVEQTQTGCKLTWIWVTYDSNIKIPRKT